MAAYPLIDIYCHIYPEKFFQEMTKVSPQTENLGKRLRTITNCSISASGFARWTLRRLPADHLAAEPADRGHRRRCDRRAARARRQ